MANAVRRDTPSERKVRRAAEFALKDFPEDDARARRKFLKNIGSFSEDDTSREHAIRIFDSVTSAGKKRVVREADVVRVPDDLNLLEVDDEGRPPVKAYSLFLKSGENPDNLLIRSDVGPNSHADCMAKMKARLGSEISSDIGRLSEVWKGMVSLVVRGRGDRIIVGVRADKRLSPQAWRGKNRDAMELLTSMGIPSEKTKVFSIDEEVFREFEKSGELWMLYPPPANKREEVEFISDSETWVGGSGVEFEGVGKGVRVFHSPGSGERFVTWSDFNTMVEGLGEKVDRNVLIRRLATVTWMMNKENDQGVAELSVFGAGEDGYRSEVKKLFEGLFNVEFDKHVLLDDLIESAGRTRKQRKSILNAYGRLSEIMRESVVRRELLSYDPDNDVSREVMYRSLQSIPLEGERELKLSKEYYASIRWLPGARMEDGKPVYHPEVKPVARRIIEDYNKAFEGRVEYINIGEIVKSQSKREKLGDELREVYFVSYKLEDEDEARLELLRKKKWDADHFFMGGVEKGVDRDAAVNLSKQYGAYVMDRIDAARFTGVRIAEHYYVGWEEAIAGTNVSLPYEYFAREYIPGPATDKLDPAVYRDRDFVRRMEVLMGRQAALNMVLGRTLFDDGDEILENGKPEELYLADMTQSFKQLDGDYQNQTGLYAAHIAKTVGRMMVFGGFSETEARETVESFYTSFGDEFKRVWREYGGDRDGWRQRYVSKVGGEVQGSKRPEPTQRQWDVRWQWTRILDNLDNIKSEGGVDGIVEVMRAETEKTVGVMRHVFRGLLPGQREGVLTAFNELLSTHPDKVDEVLEITGRDPMFKPPAEAEEGGLMAIAFMRETRLRMLRISYLTGRLGVKLSDVEDYAVEVERMNPHNALEFFEDTVSSRFRGLHLTERDAELLLRIGEDPGLRSDLTNRGYITR